jgi:hypothetical protein
MVFIIEVCLLKVFCAGSIRRDVCRSVYFCWLGQPFIYVLPDKLKFIKHLLRVLVDFSFILKGCDICSVINLFDDYWLPLPFSCLIMLTLPIQLTTGTGGRVSMGSDK